MQQMYACSRPDREAERREALRIMAGMARGYEQLAMRDGHGQWLRDEELAIAAEYQLAAVVLANAA
ncbi:MAG: hypothetical protein ACRDJ9_29520 [Dehalococcoidia bacterium]